MMILADTSVWIAHFRSQSTLLQELLDRDDISMHPFVMGELALGALRNRAKILADLADLQPVAIATPEEVLELIHAQTLYNRGIGYVDAHLLASARLTPGTRLWTLDKRLATAAAKLGIAAAAH